MVVECLGIQIEQKRINIITLNYDHVIHNNDNCGALRTLA